MLTETAHTAAKWIGVTLGMMLSACNTVKTLPIDLDYDDTEPVGFRASWTGANNWVAELSYTEASGTDTIALVGSDDNTFESRLHHKGVTLAGSQQVQVQSDFSQVKLRLLYPIPSPQKMDFYLGTALSHTRIDNRFQGTSGGFTSSARGVGVWIDFVAAYHLSNTLSVQTSIERNFAEDDSGNLAFYLRFQPLKSVYIDAGHYRFIYDSGKEQQVSYEKKSCYKPSEPCNLPYTGDISQVKQTLRGLGISLGYKF